MDGVLHMLMFVKSKFVYDFSIGHWLEAKNELTSQVNLVVFMMHFSPCRHFVF
jgi:hypothetical protein